MKNSTALCRGQWSLTLFHPKPSNVHLEEFTSTERHWIKEEKKKQYEGEKSESQSAFFMLVWSKVFVQVLMGRDDPGGWGWLDEGGSVYFTEMHCKHKISLEGGNVRKQGIRLWLQDPDLCLGFHSQRWGAHIKVQRLTTKNVFMRQQHNSY